MESTRTTSWGDSCLGVSGGAYMGKWPLADTGTKFTVNPKGLWSVDFPHSVRVGYAKNLQYLN